MINNSDQVLKKQSRMNEIHQYVRLYESINRKDAGKAFTVRMWITLQQYSVSDIHLKQ